MWRVCFPFLFLTCFFSKAQISPDKGRQSSYVTYLYHISNLQTKLILKKGINKVDESYFTNLAAEYPTDSLPAADFPLGNYLKVRTVRNQLELELVTISNVEIKILNNGSDLSLLVFNRMGIEIQSARLALGSKKIKYDLETHSYRLKKNNSKGIVSVTHNGTTSYFDLDREIDYSKFRRTFNSMVYSVPLKFIAIPVTQIIKSPYDLYRSVKSRYPKGLFYYVYKPFEDIVRSISWGEPQGFIRPFGCIFDDYYCKDSKDYKGFIALNKPKYRPGDTVKLKTYLLNHRDKLENKELEVWIGSGRWFNRRNSKKVERLLSYRPGFYETEFILHDSLKLKLDSEIRIYLVRNGEALLDESISYEDYELGQANFELRLSSDEISSRDSITAFLKGTNANGLNLLDASAEISVYPVILNELVSDSLYLKNTIWQTSTKLVASGETDIKLSSSLFPEADIEYELVAKFITADFEVHEQVESFRYFLQSKELKYEILGDTLNLSIWKGDSLIREKASITALETKYDKTDTYTLDLPGHIQLNPLIAEYIVKTTSLTDTISLRNESSKVDVFANRDADSLTIRLANPRGLDVRYFLYRKNKEIKRGFGKDWNLQLKTTTHKDYFVAINYVWAGKAYDRNYRLSLKKSNLEVQSNMPALVYPGKNQEVRVSVTNTEGKPVEGVDVTAYGLKSQFEGYSPPSLPKLEKNRPDRKLVNNFYLKNTALDKEIERKNLNWQVWNARMTLDSIGYYQFIYPENGIYNHAFPIADSITQFASYVVQDGAILPVHIVYLDEIPVYFSMAEHERKYSFAAKEGFHHLKIRTANLEIELDSVHFSKGLKNIVALDAGQLNMIEKPAQLTTQEKRLANKYLAQIRHLGLKSYMKQGDRVYWSPRNKYNMQVGPINPNADITYKVMDSYEIDFRFESGYKYEISENLIKMKSSDLPRLYINTNQKAPPFGDNVLTEKDIHQFIELVERNKQASREYTEYPKETANGNGTLALWNPYPQKIYPKNYVIFKSADPSFIRVYGGGTPVFYDLEPGSYDAYVLLDDNGYLEKRGFETRPNSTLYLKLDSLGVRQSDSVSLYFNDIIRENIKSGDEGYYSSFQDFNRLKSIYNMTRRQPDLSGDVISGIVADEMGLGIPGVNVIVKGTTIGTVTDLDGEYQLSVPANAVLVYSFIGLGSQEVEVGSRSYIDVGLTPDMQELQEVVVTAQGIQRTRRSLGYSISNVDEYNVLNGKISGMMISGTAGSSPNIMIRGYSSISSNNSPLFLIDGVPYDGTDLDLTPDDIVSMEVLKGEQAIAIYGERARNGVVIVSLKEDSHAKKMVESRYLDLAKFPDISQANPIRRNFFDYAFWQPSLTTNSEGVATFQMTFPDDVTSWNTYFLAAQGNKRTGQTQIEVRSFKPVMGTLSLPRFLVVGDSSQILGRALNYSSDTLDLTTTFEINERIIKNEITVPKAHLDSTIISPSTLDSLGVKYFIQTEKGYKDGELRKLPVYRKGVVETKGVFKVMDEPQRYQLDSDSIQGEVTIRVEGNKLPVLLDEIKTIKNYPHACNEQTASKIKALLAEREIRNFLGETFKHNDEIKRHIKRLINTTNKQGLWGWWTEGKTINWVTKHVLQALLEARQNDFEVRLEDELIINELVSQLGVLDETKLDIVELLYLLDAKIDYTSHLESMDSISLDLEGQFKLIRLKQRLKQTDYTLDSLWTHQKETIFGGMFWKSERMWVSRNSNLLTLLALEILKYEEGYLSEKQAIVHYLLGERKQGYWRNTLEASSIVESILPLVLNKEKNYEPASLTISGDYKDEVNQFPYETKATLSNGILFDKEGSGPLYLTAYQEFFNEKPKKVESDFLVNSNLDSENNGLEKGIEVNLTVDVSVNKDAEFVMVEIPIPAGCSFADKPKASWPEVHREYYRDRVAVFYEVLETGEYKIDISLMPRYSGAYSLNPAKAELMYFPTKFGREKIKRIRIE